MNVTSMVKLTNIMHNRTPEKINYGRDDVLNRVLTTEPYVTMYYANNQQNIIL